MIIKTFPIGLYSSNIYILIDDKTKEMALIDCGSAEFSNIIDEFSSYKLKYILLTHGHNDHTEGVRSIKKAYGPTVVMGKNEENGLGRFRFMDYIPVDRWVSEGDVIELGSLKISVIETPGHTLGGVCYLAEDALFSGDTLFRRSVGRWDLQGGNEETLKSSIQNKLFTLNDDVKVYPGHESSTTIGFEKKNNMYV